MLLLRKAVATEAISLTPYHDQDGQTRERIIMAIANRMAMIHVDII